MRERVILGEADIRRSLNRMAHEIVENQRTREDLLLVGLWTRGVPLAQRIAQAIESFEKNVVPVSSLDISLYRDDLGVRFPRPVLERTDLPRDLTGRDVVLVDDVLFTGRSIRAALNALMDFGRPRSIELAVLMDRGHREIPVRADYVGKNVPTALHEQVRVFLSEVDGTDQVMILAHDGEEAG